ncbi:SOUL family heme-binding protein [Pseudahrensia aquimaris]|uniref:SOUL family heme-binding protein n=1 Tax=Pseudahrensia aquimaris TaxID=744461 RepID=A0ABW3FEV0_9HYPH
MPRKALTIFLAGLATMNLFNATASESGIETPKYAIIEQADGVELRVYSPRIVAEVTVAAPSREAASSMGFGPLANYIFGQNISSDKIAMTAPVTTTPQAGEKIAMTAPVTTAPSESGSYTVRFTMPSKWTMETLPKPLDENVKLVQLEEERRIVFGFIGPRTPERIEAAEKALAEFAEARDLEVAAAPAIAGYSSPRVPQADRKWEVWQDLR